MVVRHRAAAALALVLGVASCDAPTIPEQGFAYDPRLPGGLVYHWPAGATISVFVDPEGWTQEFDARASVLAAFRQWEAVTHYRDYDLRLVNEPGVADVIVHHYDAPFLVDVSECIYPGGSGEGVTFFCPNEARDALVVLPLLSGGPGRVKMDVRVATGLRYVSPDDYHRYVTHEIGHVLGIGAHSPSASDLMFGGLLTASQPTGDDARTLRWVLRQPVDVRP